VLPVLSLLGLTAYLLADIPSIHQYQSSKAGKSTVV
jgi:hypothetical protein